MIMSIVFLIVLLLGLLIVLGAIVGIGLLLANEKTRAVGFVVAALGIGVFVCGGGSLFLLGARDVHVSDAAPVSFIRSPERAEITEYEIHPEIERTPRGIDEHGRGIAETRQASGQQRIIEVHSSVDAKPVDPETISHDSGPEEEASEKPESSEPAETPARPAWVDSVDVQKVVTGYSPASGKAYRVKATVGPYTSRMECDAHLTADVEDVVARYIENILGNEAARHVRLPDHYIRQHVVKEQWEEPVDASFGPMVQLHVLLEFDNQAREIAKKKWHDYRVQQRLWYTGAAAVVVLLMLAMAYGFLRGGWSMPGRKVLLAVVGAVVGTVVATGVVLVIDIMMP